MPSGVRRPPDPHRDRDIFDNDAHRYREGERRPSGPGTGRPPPRSEAAWTPALARSPRAPHAQRLPPRRPLEIVDWPRPPAPEIPAPALNDTVATLERLLEQAELANDVYEDREYNDEEHHPLAGSGRWRDISGDPHALREYGLSRDDLMPDNGRGFRARLYVPIKGSPCGAMPPQLVFRGTAMTSATDWDTNRRQARGLPTEHYAMAAALGRKLSRSPRGSVELVGHSLGGGLASAAAFTSGMPATTFCAAGLHEATRRWLARDGQRLYLDADIVACGLHGELLKSLQLHSDLPEAPGTGLAVAPPKGEVWPSVAGRLDSHRTSTITSALRQALDAARADPPAAEPLRMKERLHSVPPFGHFDMPLDDVRDRILATPCDRGQRQALCERLQAEARFARLFARQHRHGRVLTMDMRFNDSEWAMVDDWLCLLGPAISSQDERRRLDDLRRSAGDIRRLARDLAPTRL